MKMEGTIYCEGPDCERHAHVGADTVTAGRLPVSFVKVTEYGSGNGDTEMAFCGWDCVLKFAGRIEPPEIIPMDGGG